MWAESLHVPEGSREGQRKHPVALGALAHPPDSAPARNQQQGGGSDKHTRAVSLTRRRERVLRCLQTRQKHSVLIHTFLSAWKILLSLI